MACRSDQPHSPEARSTSSSSQDSPSKTPLDLPALAITIRIKIGERTTSKKDEDDEEIESLDCIIVDDDCFDGCTRCASGRQGQHGGWHSPSGYSDAVDRDVMKVREATAKFKTTEAAEAAGYKRVTDCVEYKPHGAMGYHYQNNALLDTTLDLEHPEVLVYEKMADGTFQLNGVEFLVPISAWKSPEPPRIMGQALTKADSIGFWFLHVWTWKASPTGLFAPWNPDVKCDAASSMHH